MKILYVTTISNTVNAFLIPHIRYLVQRGHQVDVAFQIVQEVNPEIEELGCRVFNIEFNRSPFNWKNINAYKNLKRLIKKERYQIVHTHTPVASACVRLACRRMSEVKVIYTAHGFHFYNGAPIINWIIYYPIEKWLAKYTDVLITINKEDYERAKSSFKTRTIKYVHGVGIDINKFSKRSVNRSIKRRELGLPNDAFVILSVGELNKNKNHEIIIRAMAKIKNPKLYFIICGKGPLAKYLRNLAIKLDIESNVKILGYRQDVKEIYEISDLFAFPSFREGLPVSLLEAIASGLPVICSNIRGNKELVEDKDIGYKLEPNDSLGFADAILKSINSNNDYTSIRFDRIMKYSLDRVLEEIGYIYSKLNN